MSKTAVIVALLIAVVLGAAALLLNRGGGKPEVTGPLLAFEPSAVTEIRMNLPDGQSQAVVREGGRWIVKLTGDGLNRAWPAAQTQVHAALRIFASLSADQPGDGPAKDVRGTLVITAAGVQHELKIASRRFGGRVLVESNGRSAWVDSQLSDMLISTGIQAWRDEKAFAGLGISASAITIAGQKGTLVLGQVQGKWGLREPFVEPADPEAVSRLFTILSAVGVADFCDRGPPSYTGLDQPVATLEIVSNVRESESREVRWILKVGAAAGIGDNTFAAEITRAGESPQIVVVAGEQLAAISTDPAQYVSKQPLRAEPADIGHIAVTSPATQLPCKKAEYRRNLQGWEARCDEGEWRPALKPDVEAVQALLELCTSAIPERVEVRKAGAAQGTVRIEFGTAGGTPLGAVDIAIEGTRLTAMTEHVSRAYPAGTGTIVAEWLGRR